MAHVKPKVKVEITSDTVCPWCFVGKHRLETAMAKFADKIDFEVRWLPFQLNPEMGPEPVNKLQYYREKFGAARAAQIIPMMTRTFAEEGLPAYNIQGSTGSTLDSHRLIGWAGRQFGPEKQNELVQELMQNYFCEARYLGDHDVLVAAADKVGLPGAAEFLADPQAGLEEVAQELKRAKGITGVPSFSIQGNKFIVSGAQAAAEFERIFQQLVTPNASHIPASSAVAQTC